jgi:polygalacturonase
MCIVGNQDQKSWKYARRLKLITGAAGLASAVFVCKPVLAYDIQLPNIGSTTYNVTVANSNIDGGAVAEADDGSFNNTTVINDFLSYAAAHGGGTVEVPKPSNGDYYAADELKIGNDTNLEIVSGATLENLSPDSTFLDTLSSSSTNIEISGGGELNGDASGTSGNHMCTLENITNFEVNGVSIDNASNEHLVCENDSNVLINAVTISDSKIQANTDGIDFSGSNYLIENCSIADGDDDIVAKPESTACSNIYIQNITITNGHGISIGGQTNDGLNGMFVNNVTINMASQSNANAIDLKAGAGFGGKVQNVTFNNVTVNDVDDALIISSYYASNGNESYPSIPAPAYTPATNEPFFENITLENIKVNDVSSNAMHAYGLNTSSENVSALNFENITFTNDKNPWNMFYCNDVFMSGVSVNGTTISDSEGNYSNSSGDEVSQEADDTFVSSANSTYTSSVPTLEAGSNDAIVLGGIASVPEPGTVAIGVMAWSLLLARRRRAQRPEST